MLEWLKHLSNIISVTENVLSLFPSRKSGKLFGYSYCFLKLISLSFPGHGCLSLSLLYLVSERSVH